MQSISINPTIASLTRAADPAAFVPATDRAPARRDRRDTAPRIFVHALRRALAGSTVMQLGETVLTPSGPVRADIVLEARARRIAVVVGDRASDREVMLLVYGGFEAVYRLSERDAVHHAVASVTLLEEAESVLFDSDRARLSAIGAVRRVHAGRTTLAAEGWDGCLVTTLHRRRINRPGEWAAQFELALAPGPRAAAG